jgi:urease accessory protein
MIVKGALGNIGMTPSRKRVDVVVMEWFETDRKLLRKTSSAGEEIGFQLAVPLEDGDILYEDESRIIVATLAPCELMEIAVSSIEEMGRACYELGNRHLSVMIRESGVSSPYDAPVFEYLERKGFDCSRRKGKFTPLKTTAHV